MFITKTTRSYRNTLDRHPLILGGLVCSFLTFAFSESCIHGQESEPAKLPTLPAEVKEVSTGKPIEKPKSVTTPRQEEAPAEDEVETSEGQQLWEKGQKALLEGKTHEAITCFQRSLKIEPLLASNYLSLAAAYAEQGEDELEALQLENYLRLEPEHHIIRKHLADLRIRLKQPKEAHELLERFIADIQDLTALACDHLVVTHSKLAKLAEQEEDSYGAHLNRGIGLYQLALQKAALENSDKKDVEALLCRAAGELTQARLSRPEEARPNWYLHEVWTHMAQHQPAAKALRAAEATASFSYLTPAEHRLLSLALREADKRRQP